MCWQNVAPRAWVIAFGNIGVSLFSGLFQNDVLDGFSFVRIYDCIGSRSNGFILCFLIESIYCRSKKLKLARKGLLSLDVDVVGTWSWSVVFEIYHFSQLDFEGIVGFVYLSLEMGLYRFRGEYC